MMWSPPSSTTFSCSVEVSRRASSRAGFAISSGAVAGSTSSPRSFWRARNSALPPSRISVPRPAMFVALGVRGARHARQLVVHAEVVLESDRRQGLVLALDLHAFLRFDRLVEPVRPAPARHEPPRELVHDDDLAVLDHVLHVLLEQDV